MLRIFVGYDKRQPIAFHVLSSTIHRYASQPVAVIPLIKEQLPYIKKTGLTDFTYSRYLVPYLSGFEGYSIFMDSDMIVTTDITKVLDELDDKAAVSCVNFEGQFAFERPSFMVFNNNLCSELTPEWLNDDTTVPQDLESWSDTVGKLHENWNFLVGYEKPRFGVKIIHYTQGVPEYKECRDCDYSAQWYDEKEHALDSVSWLEIMGNSVHAKPVLSRLQENM